MTESPLDRHNPVFYGPQRVFFLKDITSLFSNTEIDGVM